MHYQKIVNVELNPDRLQALGITATQVNDQIRTFNANLPGGRADVGSREQSIRTLGSAKSVAVALSTDVSVSERWREEAS